MFMQSKRLAALIGTGGVVASLFANAGQADAVVAHALIEGSGSSWAANAVNQWDADVMAAGLKVSFSSTGSAAGRRNFAEGVTDFAVSDLGYQGSDPKTGEDDSSMRPYAYVPLVAGATSFPYHLTVDGKRLTDLRLSGLTLAKIFTDQITNWNDPAITADNNGRTLQSKPIIPVVHTEGSGATFQFTSYLATMFPQIWTSFNGGKSAATEYFPAPSEQVMQNGSDAVMGYIASAAGDGAIGYDEYSYPLAAGYPVAKMLNSAGNYTLPTQYNVAVALTQAKVNMDPTSLAYLLANLTDVYTNSDPRTYPLSSYSYGIIPTSATDPRMTTAKRQTLADYLDYSICGGQARVGSIGYSSLPLNLVQAGFAQISKLNSADPGVDLIDQTPRLCDNPTFDKTDLSRNLLAEIAPRVPSCDQQGQGPCGVIPTPSPTPTASPTPIPTPSPVTISGPAVGTTTLGGVAVKLGPGTSVTKIAGGVGTGTLTFPQAKATYVLLGFIPVTIAYGFSGNGASAGIPVTGTFDAHGLVSGTLSMRISVKSVKVWGFQLPVGSSCAASNLVARLHSDPTDPPWSARGSYPRGSFSGCGLLTPYLNSIFAAQNPISYGPVPTAATG